MITRLASFIPIEKTAGLFSYECVCCKHSILAPGRIAPWASMTVVLFPDGTIIKGKYDGYGGVDGQNLYDKLDQSDCGLGGKECPEWWHEKCWVNAGKPKRWKRGSNSASDQGYFLQDDPETYKPCKRRRL